jgi:hypothetical protein
MFATAKLFRANLITRQTLDTALSVAGVLFTTFQQFALRLTQKLLGAGKILLDRSTPTLFLDVLLKGQQA